ncbi:hypothetical protein AC579_6348 [Pseudocercospora musae]|uniref:Anaphase-promoting complex subunit 5 n=1 Tax=Pseudocercospora musae TaxID=113226 RepID=A0A139I7D1_9PEZI|nr:hypothetical protein AC579_6348 [Pseudocercospora musae]
MIRREMPRYLTPARICLLILIRLYQAGHCSSDLDVLDFISRHAVVTTEHDAQAIHERKALYATSINGLAKRLQQWSTRHPGQTVYDLLAHALWELNGIDHLSAVITQMNFLTVPGGNPENPDVTVRPITPASPLGQFVRRCYVEFTRLHFGHSQALWNAFAAYRAPTFDDFSARNPDVAEQIMADNDARSLGSTPTLAPEVTETATASAVDADVLLSYSIHQLQKLGQRVPGDIKSRLGQWMGDQYDSGTQSLHFFMAFFEHWRAGEYTMALENLHRYFDYSLAARPGSDNMKIYYQYALLHLSVLHADFECWEESVDAMNECIATARENQDTACLNFALSWLLYLRHGHPSNDRAGFESVSGYIGSNGGEQDEIDFLKRRAREGKHWMLMSSTLLEEGRMAMFRGDGTNRAQEHVLQAMFLNVQNDLRTLIPAGLLFHGACLDRLGQAHLADRMYELPDAVHASHCPTNDRVRSMCRLALAASQSGNTTTALQILEGALPAVKGVLKSEQRLKAFTALVDLRYRICQDDGDAAEYYLRQLIPIRSSTDPEIAYELDLLEVELLLKSQSYEEALTKVGSRLRELTGTEKDIAQRLHFLLLKARIFALAGQAPKGFSIALRATSTAERHLLLPILFEGLTILARVLLELGEFTMVSALCDATLPHAYEARNTGLTARLFVAMGEAAVGHAGHGCAGGSTEQVRSMRKAMGLIERGREMYQRTKDIQGQLDCLLMKSKIASWSEDAASASQADDMYLQLLADKEARA